jgi:hypothetical protein
VRVIAPFVHAESQFPGYESSVRASVSIPTPDDQLMIFQFLYEFAAKEQLWPSEGRHILQGHAVNDLKLRLDKNTFFFATNSENVHELLLYAFSKESDAKWRPIWTRLVSQLKTNWGGRELTVSKN